MLAILLAFTIGYSALDLDTGRTVSHHAGQRFPMGSVFKFPLALTVLHLVDEKKLDLDHSYTIQPAEFSPGYSPIRDGAHGQAVTMTLRAARIVPVWPAMLTDACSSAFATDTASVVPDFSIACASASTSSCMRRCT